MKYTETYRTPVNKNYNSCYECYAILLIYPADIHPDEITKLLDQKPTLCLVFGDEFTNVRGMMRKVKCSIWELSSNDFMESRDIRDHIDWLLDKIEPRSKELKELQENPDLTMCIYCTWRAKRGYGGPVLWPSQMKRMSDLNLECSFDAYFFTED